jgi:hypothetical protein
MARTIRRSHDVYGLVRGEPLMVWSEQIGGSITIPADRLIGDQKDYIVVGGDMPPEFGFSTINAGLIFYNGKFKAVGQECKYIAVVPIGSAVAGSQLELEVTAFITTNGINGSFVPLADFVWTTLAGATSTQFLNPRSSSGQEFIAQALVRYDALQLYVTQNARPLNETTYSTEAFVSNGTSLPSNLTIQQRIPFIFSSGVNQWSGGIYTIPSTGVYDVEVQACVVEAGPSRLFVAMWANGTEVSRGNDDTNRGLTAGDIFTSRLTTWQPFTSGDSVDFRVIHSGAAATYSGAGMLTTRVKMRKRGL